MDEWSSNHVRHCSGKLCFGQLHVAVLFWVRCITHRAKRWKWSQPVFFSMRPCLLPLLSCRKSRCLEHFTRFQASRQAVASPQIALSRCCMIMIVRKEKHSHSHNIRKHRLVNTICNGPLPSFPSWFERCLAASWPCAHPWLGRSLWMLCQMPTTSI